MRAPLPEILRKNVGPRGSSGDLDQKYPSGADETSLFFMGNLQCLHLFNLIIELTHIYSKHKCSHIKAALFFLVPFGTLT